MLSRTTTVGTFFVLCGFLHALVCPAEARADKQRVSYFILAETVEPLAIVRNGDPMAGGMFTEIVKKVFENSAYAVTPMVMPLSVEPLE
jgi:hypothetical protein